MRPALLITCFNDMMFPRTGRAVTELLERLGHTVEFPQGQTCCGQMHFNTGYRPQTLPMVRRFAEVFAGYDAVVTPSGSCAGRSAVPLESLDRVGVQRDGDETGAQVGVGPLLPACLAPSQSAERDQVEQRVRAVLRDMVEEEASVLRRPDHHRRRLLAGALPVEDALLCWAIAAFSAALSVERTRWRVAGPTTPRRPPSSPCDGHDAPDSSEGSERDP